MSKETHITNNPCLICCSGNSIPFKETRLDKRFEKVIKNNFSLGLNYWFKFGCETTANVSVDYQFYLDQHEEMKKIPMIVAKHDKQLTTRHKSKLHDNTILLPASVEYSGKNSWDKGFYTGHLVSMFSLTFSIALGFQKIYLLGADHTGINGKTHFYQDLVDLEKEGKITGKKLYSGLGYKGKQCKTTPYNNKRNINENLYKCYLQEKDVKIYNVSMMSNIDVFEKIDYETFYDHVEKNITNQTEAREFILKTVENNKNG